MKRVIIIGATSGIGLELAKLYIKNGDKVGATGRRAELLDQFQKEFPDQIFTECFDVMGTENISHLEALINKLGGMDILVYNSGYGDISKSLDWELDKRTTLTNVNGFLEIVNYAFNFFAKKGEGQIAAVSSLASVRGNSWAPAYSASKAFMSNYMEGLHVKAKRMSRSKGSGPDIAVTDIQPGFVKTKMAKGEGQFWVAPVEKAARQIFTAIRKKRRRVYVTRRWAIVAWVLKWLPYWVFKRIA